MDFCDRPQPSCSATNTDSGCLQYSEPSAKLGVPLFNSASDQTVCVDCQARSKPCASISSYSPILRLVGTAVLLQNVDGATQDELFAMHNQVCPDVPLTNTEVGQLLRHGKSRGIFVTSSTRVGGWLVKGDFPLRASNLKLLEEVGSQIYECLGLYGCPLII